MNQSSISRPEINCDKTVCWYILITLRGKTADATFHDYLTAKLNVSDRNLKIIKIEDILQTYVFK